MSLWGYLISPTCELASAVLLSFLVLITIFLVGRTKGKVATRIRSNLRVGPHNSDILSIIYGTLLGDGQAELRSLGTRVSFYQEAIHSEYLLWLHAQISTYGYCPPSTPAITQRLGVGGQMRQVIRFHTFTYSSWNSIYADWYTNSIKHVPANIAEYLTPLALAIWIMDDGGRVGYGLKLATNSFTFEDTSRLALVLTQLYGIKASVHKNGVPNQYNIYIWSESMPLLRSIVTPYFVPSMLYKLGERSR